MTSNETVADLVDRLRLMTMSDHLRGCAGRECACTCEFDAAKDAILSEAASTLTSLEAERDRLREALDAYDTAIVMTRGEGGRRSWKMNGAKIAKAFDLHRAALSGEGEP